ncbi:MAG: hypothetical protein QF449_14345 [Alphaproteobacteria bacterium]|jgi:hypothetical protein|nr:hypothetical protein [Alphaproteobacteria bacterium]MDP6819205.1 hypothetical protein [Alphaproteobacteria bacterium]|tara:strand:+ start:2772 stop:3032 length:261 start_codon:yes stop_codon:yes gene_type:complete
MSLALIETPENAIAKAAAEIGGEAASFLGSPDSPSAGKYPDIRLSRACFDRVTGRLSFVNLLKYKRYSRIAEDFQENSNNVYIIVD